ncbi:MAG: GIY-YIG nuclease family protein [Raoultibacter sp.]
MSDAAYFVYLLRCSDDTLYTGITDDIEHRVAAHNSGKGAKYTRGRGPVVVVHVEKYPDRSTALKRELAIKKLTRSEKQALIKGEDEGKRSADRGGGDTV